MDHEKVWNHRLELLISKPAQQPFDHFLIAPEAKPCPVANPSMSFSGQPIADVPCMPCKSRQ